MLSAGVWLSLSGCFGSKQRKFPGGIVGANFQSGHMLRTGGFPQPSATREKKAVIVGGGISGLSAAWWLERRGFTDYELLELDKQVGGNSQSGENAVSAYPWGAHYIPVPGEETEYLRLLLEEMQVITGRDSSGRPQYDELFLCAAPEERLFILGSWQAGLLPSIGVNAEDRAEYDRFFALIKDYRNLKGSDDRRAFAIPIDLSSRDEKYLTLDRISFADFLTAQNFKSKPLIWYLDYCCLDDYGVPSAGVSAWAGIHYFAARGAWADGIDGYEVITWPEGNGKLVHHMRDKAKPRLNTSAVVYSIAIQDDSYLVDYFDTAEKTSKRIRTANVIFAAPRFTAPFIVKGLRESAPEYLSELDYSPWMVANVTVKTFPGFEDCAWDNVFYQSPSLGYVVATHQDLETYRNRSVLTYYLPLAGTTAKEARTEALARTFDEWCQMIVGDLRIAHRQIEDYIERIDVLVWGHGMIRPKPGYIWSKNRAQRLDKFGGIIFAHSDMSGVSIFEEAQYWGVQAAEKILSQHA